MPNRLGQENSPYLLQHANNPVDWYPWGPEAFERARQEDKPIHLSVGYAACHWCHVMAHESFENEETARLLNESFINIKVDRQERPDIDDIYQKVLQMNGEGGGWPLTVFLTPEKEPFFAGTYFPPTDRFGRPAFRRLITALNEAWKNRRQEILTVKEGLLEGYRELNEDGLRLRGQETSSDTPLRAAHLIMEETDPVYGGPYGAPKFPNVSWYDLLLRVYQRTREPSLYKALQVTLNGMANGGIYDHLGGGFSRYSVDERWLVPHFEKMLYDNAQLVKLFADAYRLTGCNDWRRVFEECIHYVLREMRSVEGGFFASEDADSEGEEGKFYVWTPRQIKEVLGDVDGDFVCHAYGVTEAGNFEQGKTVLSRAAKLSAKDELRLQPLRKRLFAERSKRARPGRDENVITSWNALMIEGLCAAYQATGHQEYLNVAKRTAQFIERQLTTPEGGLLRVWSKGKGRIPGFVDDYTFMINALIDLYECSFDTSYLNRAIELTGILLDNFFDGGFYFTHRDGEKLVHRPRSIFDGAYPSGTSTGVFALLRLYELTGRDAYRECVEQVFGKFGPLADKNPHSFAHLLSARDFAQQGPSAIVIAGDKSNVDSFINAVHRMYLPGRLLAFAEDVPIGKGRFPMDGKTVAYVCRKQTCSLPFKTAQDLATALEY